MKICKDCIHYYVCSASGGLFNEKDPTKEMCCNNFKDKGVVLELPCKMGDILYIPAIDEDANKAYIEECPVNDISTKRIFISCKNPPGDDCDDNYLVDELGKNIFLTKESAE